MLPRRIRDLLPSIATLRVFIETLFETESLKLPRKFEYIEGALTLDFSKLKRILVFRVFTPNLRGLVGLAGLVGFRIKRS